MAQHTFNTTATAGTECRCWNASGVLYHQLLLTATKSDGPSNLKVLVSGPELLHLEMEGTITLKLEESKNDAMESVAHLASPVNALLLLVQPDLEHPLHFAPDLDCTSRV